MGSVIDYIECPRCHQPNCIDDFYYKSGEEIINCPDCGYRHSSLYKRDENGNYIKKDDTKEYTFDNLVREEVLMDTPYGAYRVESIKGGATCGTLNTDDDYQNFISGLADAIKEENEIKSATISRLVNGEIKVETIYEKPSPELPPIEKEPDNGKT